MGTNYYMSVNACKCCGRPETELHIGKSSAGWVFSLNTHPDNGIEGLEDWRAAWADNRIRDEYGRFIEIEEMDRIITQREGYQGRDLTRHEVDGRFCLTHGKGTFDLMRGDFS